MDCKPRLYIDIETYCTLDLKKTGVYPYAHHRSFLILMAAYALNDEPVQIVFGYDVLAIPGLFDPNVLKVAHNAQFERICFSVYSQRVLEVEPGEYLDPSAWHDTMAVAAENGYPQKLETLAKWLHTTPKDEAGVALIRWFCVPDRKGQRRLPEDHPEKWQQFCDYCVQDVETLREIDKALGDFPTEAERELWITDQIINDRGVRIDVPMVKAAQQAAEDNRMEQELEASGLTGLVNPNSTEQLLGWLRRQGFTITNLQKETVEKLLEREDLTTEQRRVLEIRQELALAASSKFTAALVGLRADGRLPGQFRFFGAHTGRWAARGAQLHNLPRLSFTWIDPETDKKDFDEAGQNMAILDLLLGNGASSETLKKLVRPMILGPLTTVDYSAIEARVLPWIAGEEWPLQAFRDGRDIYVETAERMSTPGNTLTRFQGKVAVLALGYNGSINSLRAMGGDGTDEELQALVNQWRSANPAIVRFWKELGIAFEKGGTVGAGLVSVEVEDRTRRIRLPSGRAITYHGCKWVWEEGKWGKNKQAYFRSPVYGTPQRTYGGSLAENVTQAVARDLMGHSLVQMVKAGLPVVMHVHDEVVADGTDFDTIRQHMLSTPAWAAGLPVDGAGYVADRYRKD